MAVAGNSVSKVVWVVGLVWVLGLELIHCSVSYDRKALVIDGQRRILFSGSIHYPRSTPDVRSSCFRLSLIYCLLSEKFCAFFC